MNLTDLPGIPSAAQSATMVVVALIALAAMVYVVKPMVAALLRRTSVAVIGGFVAAMGCTGYSADSSWRFAGEKLDMTSLWERGLLFATAEAAMLALVFMARQNLNDPDLRAPGVPGTLIKVVTCVQIIPSIQISDGLTDGAVRAFFGPVLAMLLWHQVLGVELRHNKGSKGEDTDVNTMWAQISRAVRERTFYFMGLSERDQTAVQIAQDKAMSKAVGLTIRLQVAEETRHTHKAESRSYKNLRIRQAKAASKACGGSAKRREMLLSRIAERRNAHKLATMDQYNVWSAPEAPAEVEAAPVAAEALPEPETAEAPLAVEPEPVAEVPAVPVFEPEPDPEPEKGPKSDEKVVPEAEKPREHPSEPEKPASEPVREPARTPQPAAKKVKPNKVRDDARARYRKALADGEDMGPLQLAGEFGYTSSRWGQKIIKEVNDEIEAAENGGRPLRMVSGG